MTTAFAGWLVGMLQPLQDHHRAEHHRRRPGVHLHHLRGRRWLPADRWLRLGDRRGVRRADLRHGPAGHRLRGLGQRLALRLPRRDAPRRGAGQQLGQDTSGGRCDDAPTSSGDDRRATRDEPCADARPPPGARPSSRCATSASPTAASSRCATSPPRCNAGEVTCVLGDNGAGKSTFIKILAGAHEHTDGEFVVDGVERHFSSPRAALALGIATVYQDLAVVPLMPVWRNFFLGSEMTKGVGPLRRLDIAAMKKITKDRAGRDGHRPARRRPADRHAVGWRAAVCRDRPRGLLRRAGADPRRADGGARRAAVRRGAEVHRQGPRPRPRRHLHHPQPAPRLSGGRPVHAAAPRPQHGQLPQGGDDARRAGADDGRRRRARGAQPRAGPRDAGLRRRQGDGGGGRRDRARPTPADGATRPRTRPARDRARELGVAVVGFGWMGQVHARAWARLLQHYPDSPLRPRLVAVADPDAGQPRRGQSAYGFAARATPTGASCWRATTSTWSASAGRTSCTARSRSPRSPSPGEHLWIEKPAGRDRADTAAIAAAVRKAGRAVGGRLQLPQRAGGRAGARAGRRPVGSARSRRSTSGCSADYAAHPDGALSWRFDPEYAGTGVLGDLASHGFDLATYVGGRARPVGSASWSPTRRRSSPSVPSRHRRRVALRRRRRRARGAGRQRGPGLGAAALRVGRPRRTSSPRGSPSGSSARYGIEVRGTQGALSWDFRRMGELRVCLDQDYQDAAWQTRLVAPGRRGAGRLPAGRRGRDGLRRPQGDRGRAPGASRISSGVPHGRHHRGRGGHGRAWSTRWCTSSRSSDG